jgi:hypothetical protein
VHNHSKLLRCRRPTDVRFPAWNISLYLSESSTVTSVGSLFGLHYSGLCWLSNKGYRKKGLQYYEIMFDLIDFPCVFSLGQGVVATIFTTVHRANLLDRWRIALLVPKLYSVVTSRPSSSCTLPDLFFTYFASQLFSHSDDCIKVTCFL